MVKVSDRVLTVGGFQCAQEHSGMEYWMGWKSKIWIMNRWDSDRVEGGGWREQMNKRPSVKLKAEVSMVSLNDCGKSGWDWFGKGLEEDLGWSICHLTKKKKIHIKCFQSDRHCSKHYGCQGEEYFLQSRNLMFVVEWGIGNNYVNIFKRQFQIVMKFDWFIRLW